MSKMRLDKFLSSQLNCTRTEAKKILKNEIIKINGIAVKKSDYPVDVDSDTVVIGDKKIEYKKYVYIMLNKPEGVVSATNDPEDVTVIDILPEKMKRKGLFPAGRLDKDTVGFVLITDNGDFAHDILSPSHHVEKTYIAETQNKLSQDDILRFIDGMSVGTETFKPAGIRLMEDISVDTYFYEVKIIEGRYHQIKRMFSATGNPLISLKRIAIGSLYLDEKLKPGEAKELTEAELLQIKLH